MSATGPVARVVAVLKDAGYEVLDQPRRVGGIPFEFAAMLAGQTSLDLIVVIDLAVDVDDERIRQHPRILLTPHTAGPTWQSFPRRFANCFANIERVHNGEKAQWVVPELADLFA